MITDHNPLEFSSPDGPCRVRWGTAMRPSSALWQRACPTGAVAFLIISGVLGFSITPASAQLPNVPPGIIDTLERVQQRNAANIGERGEPAAPKEFTCLLSPLAFMHSPTINVVQLQKAAGAREEYLRGCEDLRKKKNDQAEKHFRKALQQYPKYALVWVTLGQLLAKEQRTAEGRDDCSQASAVDPRYVAAYLCLADIAAQARNWDEVLKFSARALELEPTSNAVAHEYNAIGNLNLHHLAEAEKSGLLAVEIDREHRDPHVHFVLAQIYEAKQDSASEAAQLREYLKYCNSVTNAALVGQWLANLEQQMAQAGDPGAEIGVSDPPRSSAKDWGPPDVDASIPPVVNNGACPLTQILKETSSRTLDLIDNMERFSASERIEQIDIDKKGKRGNSSTEMVNYVAQIGNNSGYPSIQEYRSEGGRVRPAAVMDFGAAVFALIFHPSHIGNFDFRCEGLTELQGTPAWQMHFEESSDPNRAFSAVSMSGSLNLIRLKGRAWITTDRYNVLRIETDLADPIARIKLQREHQVITYAPVDFPKRHIELWLPETSSLYIAYRGNHYERIHTFSDYQLFSVDSTEAVKDQGTDKIFQFRF